MLEKELKKEKAQSQGLWGAMQDQTKAYIDALKTQE